MIGIYKITSPTGRVYIGQTLDSDRRLRSYKRQDCKTQIKLYRSVVKYGWESHSFEIIEECIEDTLNERERYWQEFFKTTGNKGLNCVLTKTADKSGKMAESTKLKIKKALTGHIRSEEECKAISKRMKGTKLSEATKEKIRNVNLGRKHTEETKAKMSKNMKEALSKNNWNKGVKRSQEFKDNVSKFHKGKKLTLEQKEQKKLTAFKKEIIQFNLDMEVVKMFESVRKAADTTGIKQPSISNNLTGRSKTAGGFIWKYHE